MSVMCIGQLAMQGAVNALGTEAIAGYTAATKVDQFSVLMNAALVSPSPTMWPRTMVPVCGTVSARERQPACFRQALQMLLCV